MLLIFRFLKHLHFSHTRFSSPTNFSGTSSICTASTVDGSSGRHSPMSDVLLQGPAAGVQHFAECSLTSINQTERWLVQLLLVGHVYDWLVDWHLLSTPHFTSRLVVSEVTQQTAHVPPSHSGTCTVASFFQRQLPLSKYFTAAEAPVPLWYNTALPSGAE